MKEAVKYHVLPIDDRPGALRTCAGGPSRSDGGRTSLTVYQGMTGMMENVFINVKNRSHTITAELDIPGGANGVILAQGGRFGGWSSTSRTAGRPTPTTGSACEDSVAAAAAAGRQGDDPVRVFL